MRAEVALRGEGDNGAEGNLKMTNKCLEAKRDDCLLGDEGGAQPLFTEGLGLEANSSQVRSACYLWLP